MDSRAPAVIRNIRVPVSVLRDPAGFGGRRVGDCLQGDAIVQDGCLTGLLATNVAASNCRLMIPALTEAHCHLDKCHTISRMSFEGGDLRAAIEAQRADKAHWSADDLRSRAERGLGEAIAAGCGAMRSHIDWGDTTAPPLAWSVLLELAQDSAVHLQLAALTNIAQMAEPAFARDVTRAIPDGHALGSFVLGHPEAEAGLRSIFAVAQARGLALDLHVDETTDPAMNGLELIADLALETGHQGPILCGHAVSLAYRPPDDVARIADKLARAGISVVAMPQTNLYLQGRRDGTPVILGLTALRELDRAGVPIVLGTDNVRDAFCPVGRHDPMRALELGVLAGHLDPPLGRWLPSITTHARAALGLPAGHLDGAPLETLRIADASDLSDLISGASHRPAMSLTKEFIHG